ncbi:hypothetical protein [Nocardia rhizosphaerae]|uniref:Minor tail protein n=1 Tax=Nocardia rhizosphaerae TaxID=1691571 RepID=A0ABV8L2Z4_9NOCA
MTTIGEYFEQTQIRGINEGIGEPGIAQSFNGTPKDGSLELPTGSPGPTGPQGPAAHRFRWEGDISDPVALASLAESLGPAQAGKAWRVESTNTLMYWNGSAFDVFAEAFGGHGPTGEVNTLTMGTVTTGAVGADLEITITGTPPSQTLDITVPRGVQGAQGPIGSPGPLREATDYDDTTPPVDGAVPLWNSTTSKWTPTPYPGWRGPWTAFEGASWDGGAGFIASASGTSTSPNTLCTINVPAQDVDWRPLVFGGALVRTTATDNSNRVDIEARITNAAGQIVGYGPGTPFGLESFTRVQPQYNTASMTPASSVGVVSAGVPAVIAIVLRRNLGSGSYNYIRTGAHATVWAVPVTGAP